MPTRTEIRTQIRVVIVAVGFLLFFFNVRLAALNNLWMAALIVLVALVRLAEVKLPQGDKISLDAALVLAAMLLFSLPSALAIAIGGMVIATLSRQKTPDFGRPLYMVAERSIVVVTAGLWTGGRYVTAPSPNTLNLLGWDLLAAAALCLTFFVLEIGLDQLSVSNKHESPFIPAFLGSFALMSHIYFSLASIAILISMMYPSMGIWSILIFGLPLIVVHYSFKLFLDIKNTYKHTIAALTRAIQVEDYHHKSHSERVADLAVDIGREMGLYGDKLEKLGYAAMLHDIGKLGLDIDSFDAALDSRNMNENEVPHAQIGAEILEQVEFLKEYADVVRKHHLPFANKRNINHDHPPAARIIAVANYFDLITQTPLAERRLTPNQAVARLKKEALQFDPKVMRALINVLKRQHRLIVTAS
ncbi:MAG TPA: HD domain-containing protein [Actinobacteria bacterium]|nr:HD domain-containing protein [Actinomycetota bacterium]